MAERVDLDALMRKMVDVLDASVARHCTLIYNATEAVDGVITVETGQ